jgi:hypothetical protein
MSLNPYEASAMPPVQTPSSQHDHAYRSTHGIAAWASWWLLATGAAEFLMAIPFFFLEPILEGDADQLGANEWSGETLLAVGLRLIGVACMTMVANIVGIVLYCVWAYRANKNARALGAQGMQFTPGWMVGWYFIPFMNLFKPYQAIKETYQASDPDADAHSWPQPATPALLGVWWAMWLASNVLGQAEFRMSLSDDPNIAGASRWVSIVSSVVGLIAAVLVFKVIRTIHHRQEAKVEAVQKQSSQAAYSTTSFADFS